MLCAYKYTRKKQDERMCDRFAFIFHQLSRERSTMPKNCYVEMGCQLCIRHLFQKGSKSVNTALKMNTELKEKSIFDHTVNEHRRRET
jgi:hypothetical protein